MTPPPNMLRERVARINLGALLTYATGWTCRIWREESMDAVRDNFTPHRSMIEDDIFKRIQQHVQMTVTPLELAKSLLSLERVNAVEIIDVTGAGEVLYKDWP